MGSPCQLVGMNGSDTPMSAATAFTHTPGEVIIHTESLRRLFNQTVALKDLSLTINRGEIFGLVGPDGAGKTTTLRILAGIMDPTAGSVEVLGYDTRTDPERIKQHIGYMAQSFSLYGDLSVEENLNFFADVYGVTGPLRQERIEKLLEFARLTRFRDRRAGKLSGGMQKKLGLACTLIHQPEILLLDEPTLGVDPVSRREFWDILTGLHIEGVTIVVTTPYMDEAERCSRIGLIYEGALIVKDTPAGIKKLVPGEIIQIQASDRTRTRDILSRQPFVREIQNYGTLLHLFVDNAQNRTGEVRRLLEAEGIDLTILRQVEPRVEEAFISLIRRQTEGINKKIQ